MLAPAAIGALWLSSEFPNRHTWEAVDDEGRLEGDDEDGGDRDERSTGRLALGIVACGLLILGAAFSCRSPPTRRRNARDWQRGWSISCWSALQHRCRK